MFKPKFDLVTYLLVGLCLLEGIVISYQRHLLYIKGCIETPAVIDNTNGASSSGQPSPREIHEILEREQAAESDYIRIPGK